MLLANIGILTASSFCLSVSHIIQTRLGYFLTSILGILFLCNQVDETFSNICISGVEESSSVLFCLFTHLSHLVLSLILFGLSLLYISSVNNDNILIFVSAY